MKNRQSLIIAPPREQSCQRCDKWSRYESNPSWGKCNEKNVPRYTKEIYFSRGCNMHSVLAKRTKRTIFRDECEQLSLF